MNLAETSRVLMHKLGPFAAIPIAVLAFTTTLFLWGLEDYAIGGILLIITIMALFDCTRELADDSSTYIDAIYITILWVGAIVGIGLGITTVWWIGQWFFA